MAKSTSVSWDTPTPYRRRYFCAYLRDEQRCLRRNPAGQETALAHDDEFGTTDLLISGVVSTTSGKYMLEGLPTMTIVGGLKGNGAVPPIDNDQGGRSGRVYSATDGTEDGTLRDCSAIVDNERGQQIVLTESGSRYRVFPSGGDFVTGQRVTVLRNGRTGTVKDFDTVTGRCERVESPV